MSEPVLEKLSKVMNDVTLNDKDDEKCIRTIVGMDQRVYEAIAKYKEKQNSLDSNSNDKMPIVTGTEMRDFVDEQTNRPMISDTKNNEYDERTI